LQFGNYLAGVPDNVTASTIRIDLQKNLNYPAYLDQCAVQTCKYTQVSKQSALTVVTVVFSLVGGLSVALRYPFALGIGALSSLNSVALSDWFVLFVVQFSPFGPTTVGLTKSLEQTFRLPLHLVILLPSIFHI
jgi:hypothetical protein